jgi:magnesium-protoporphyrin O-methyltransferase
MTDPALGGFDHVVAMDSLIHYERDDALRVLDGWAQRTRGSLLFTFAPSSPLLRAMHLAGKLFPRGDRSPAIVPLAETGLRRALHDALPAWQVTRCERVASGFYTSQALQLQRG